MISWKKYCLSILAGLGVASANAQEINEVLPLTDKIIMIHLDEGSVEHKSSTLTKTSLDYSLADNADTYDISSSTDGNYSSAVSPIQVGRKTRGTEYNGSVGAKWTGSSYDPTTEPWAKEHWIYLVLETPLQTGHEYQISTGNLSSSGSNWSFTFDEKSIRSEAVHVNTIGYHPDAPKYGYIYHWPGSLDTLDFSRYAGNAFWVIDTESQSIVKEGTISFRAYATNVETGQPEDTPNDNFLGSQVYEANFTDLTMPGIYVLSIEGIGSSYPFYIGSDPVWKPYYHAMRALYHQRSGIRIDEQYGDTRYLRPVTQNPMVTDSEYGGISFEGRILYSKVPFTRWTNEAGGVVHEEVVANAEGNPLNVAGWYHDAGDWDAYYTHQRIPILLMTTYEHNPTGYSDDEMDIPESGNGIPDIVDEASWLVKFNYRLRKESMKKGYSDGGVGGARVAPDPFNGIDAKSEEEGLPSWQDARRYAVTEADAFMTYMYAGQAAQLALIVKNLGKDPKKHPVENLDAIRFEDMSYDTVNFINEAEEAFAWANNSENQPETNNLHGIELYMYRTYAAVNLYRITDKRKYHDIAKEGLNIMKSANALNEDQRFAVSTYMLADNVDVDKGLQESLKSTIRSTAEYTGASAADKRATRWGTIFDFPMLIGQATTPWMFDNIVAYKVTGDERFKNTVHTTVDYFLGTNPLHTTWMTGVGPNPITAAFNLDARHIGDSWDVYPGWVPYGPWRMDENTTLFTFEMPDGITRDGGMGPWDPHWLNFSVTPTIEKWPGHERLSSNVHSPLAAENTVHQNAVHAAISYGFVNGRKFSNASSVQPVGEIELDTGDFTFQYVLEQVVITPTLDNSQASFSAVEWSSSDYSVAHVDQFGRITALTNGTAVITCHTLDNSVSESITVTCENLQELPVSSLNIEQDTIQMNIGTKKKLTVTIEPENAANVNFTWFSADPSVASAEENEMTALQPGTTWIYATSDSNNEAKDSVYVNVLDADYTIFADFDDAIPATDEIKPDSVQFFSPGNTMDISADNPAKDVINSSDKVVRIEKSAGEYKLIGLASPSELPLIFCQHSDLHFSYYSEDLTEFLIVVTLTSGEEISQTINKPSSSGWNKLVVNMPANGFMEKILIFINPTDPSEFTAYFDDFKFQQIPGREGCETSEILLDFESIQLDWQNGYGSFAFNSSEHGIIYNDRHIPGNSSAKIFRWERDGTNAGGGFGFGIPIHTLRKHTKAEFLAYSSKAFESLRVEWQKGSEENAVISEITLEQPVPANTWTKVSWNIREMSNTNLDSISQIIIQPALGTSTVLTFWIDDLALNGIRPQEIITGTPDEIQLKVGETYTLNAEVAPANSDNTDVIWTSSDTGIAEVSSDGEITAITEGVTIISIASSIASDVRKEIMVVVISPLGLDETNSTIIYPNPADDELYINSKNRVFQVLLYDMSGKLVLQNSKIEGLSFKLNISRLQHGLYKLKIINNSGQESFLLKKM